MHHYTCSKFLWNNDTHARLHQSHNQYLHNETQQPAPDESLVNAPSLVSSQCESVTLQCAPSSGQRSTKTLSQDKCRSITKAPDRDDIWLLILVELPFYKSSLAETYEESIKNSVSTLCYNGLPGDLFSLID